MKVNSINSSVPAIKPAAKNNSAQKTAVSSVLKVVTPVLELIARVVSLTNPSAAAVAAVSPK